MDNVILSLSTLFGFANFFKSNFKDEIDKQNGYMKLIFNYLKQLENLQEDDYNKQILENLRLMDFNQFKDYMKDGTFLKVLLRFIKYKVLNYKSYISRIDNIYDEVINSINKFNFDIWSTSISTKMNLLGIYDYISKELDGEYSDSDVYIFLKEMAPLFTKSIKDDEWGNEGDYEYLMVRYKGFSFIKTYLMLIFSKEGIEIYNEGMSAIKNHNEFFDNLLKLKVEASKDENPLFSSGWWSDEYIRKYMKEIDEGYPLAYNFWMYYKNSSEMGDLNNEIYQLSLKKSRLGGEEYEELINKMKAKYNEDKLMVYEFVGDKINSFYKEALKVWAI